eukprot:12399984-Karenia_brevis.AAC.1
MTGRRPFGLTSVLKPKTAANALAVPFSHGLFLQPRMVPKVLRCPDTRRPLSLAIPGQTRSGS